MTQLSSVDVYSESESKILIYWRRRWAVPWTSLIPWLWSVSDFSFLASAYACGWLEMQVEPKCKKEFGNLNLWPFDGQSSTLTTRLAWPILQD